MEGSFVRCVRDRASKQIIFTEHALDRMNQQPEVITPHEVREVIFNGKIIEDYPEDKRGHSCLMYANTGKDRPLHVVCSPKEDYLGIITVYVPTSENWERDFTTRRN